MLEGIGRGFAIERSFEDDLWNTVAKDLQGNGKAGRVIILHGQSATGKSIAMARLAWKLRRLLKAPVLVALDRLPSASIVEEYCAVAERVGNELTVLLNDANQTPQRYFELANDLQSRGRRLLLIGTCYRQPKNSSKKYYFEAPAELKEAELKELKGLIRRFTGKSMEQYSAYEQKHILLMLYRNLSSSRYKIFIGVGSHFPIYPRWHSN